MKNLGCLYISWPEVVKQSEEIGTPSSRRLMVLGVHGICHLLGYNHEYDRAAERMESKEDEIIAKMDELMPDNREK